MTLLSPGTEEYEAHRAPAIARFLDVRPRYVARCASVADVVEALSLARREGLPVAVRSGGHDFEGRSSCDGVVVDVGPMDAVSVDGPVAVIGAGARLGDVYDALDAHGLTLAAGCGPDVGISGLTLGGGLGILGRLHGLTCDQVLSARVVLADGIVVECDESREPDLFWLLRGAGAGRAGVVVEWTFRTVPAPTVTVFRLAWAEADAEAVLDAWQEWVPDAPDEMAGSLLVSAPADPRLPLVAEAFGAMAAGPDAAEAELGRLRARAGVEPVTAVFEHVGYREGKRRLGLLGGDDRPAEGGDEYSRNEFLRSAVPSAELVARLRAGRVAGEHRTLDFSPWGGAYTRVAADATAFPHRDARALLKHDANLVHGTDPAGALAWLDESWALAHPSGTGGSYANFPDPRLVDEAGAYFLGNAARVAAVRGAYGWAPASRGARPRRPR